MSISSLSNSKTCLLNQLKPSARFVLDLIPVYLTPYIALCNIYSTLYYLFKYRFFFLSLPPKHQFPCMLCSDELNLVLASAMNMASS